MYNALKSLFRFSIHFGMLLLACYCLSDFTRSRLFFSFFSQGIPQGCMIDILFIFHSVYAFYKVHGNWTYSMRNIRLMSFPGTCMSSGQNKGTTTTLLFTVITSARIHPGV